MITLPVYDVFGFIMLRDDPLAQKEYVTVEDMRGKPLIVNRGILGSGMLHDQPLFQNVVATYSLIYNGSLMVADGLGYMFCLDKILNLSGDSPLCFRPFMPQVKINIGLAWKKFQVFSKASEKFLALLRNELMQQDLD